jgi:hypothetical protein
LRERTELLRMLVDPRRRIEDSQDPLDETGDSFKKLDDSKQKALREILATIPLFLLQGPPGVGKTYLVGDVVQRRFDDEPTTRILLSAQSNSAIDHLMSEVQAIFRTVHADARPLMVRARPADDDESAGEFEIDIQAESPLQTLADSSLVADAAPHIRDRIRELADARKVATGSRQAISSSLGRRMSSELRAFEGMILEQPIWSSPRRIPTRSNGSSKSADYLIGALSRKPARRPEANCCRRCFFPIAGS